MAIIINNKGYESFRDDLVAVFDSLQEERTALIEDLRSTQLAARVLLLGEARRLSARDASDARSAKLRVASNTIAQRVAALNVEAQISKLRTAPPPRVEPAAGNTK